MAFSIEQPRLLVVEGEDDLHFFRAFLDREGIDDVDVHPVGGKNRFREVLGTLRLTPGFRQLQALALVRDADDNFTSAFQSACSALRGADFEAPTEPEVSCGTDPRVGVFLIPGKNQTGMLETLCMASVVDDPSLPCIDDYIDCVKQSGLTLGPLDKVRAYTFLAAREKPGLRLSIALEARYWNFDHQVFDALKAFLRHF